MSRELPVLCLLAGFMLIFGSTSSKAESQSIYAQMLDSAVFVECDVEFQGELLVGGSGSGFLIANSEYVITNNHVIDQCHPDNREAVLREQLQKAFFVAIENDEEFQAGVERSLVQSLEADAHEIPELRLKLQNDPEFAEQYVLAKINEHINTRTKADLPNIGQKLFIVYMGKQAQSPITVDVSNIIWASSKADEKSRETGVDIAILKLTRPLADRPSVRFATGSSAQVSDEVYAVGFPGASGDIVASAKYIPTLKKGIISKLGGEDPRVTKAASDKGWKGTALIETDASISPGNSGGPLYNQYGEVLGINSFIPADRASGIGWAQDIAVVIPVLNDLGLPLPEVFDKRRTWFDKNSTLVWAITGTGALLLLFGVIAIVSRQRQRTSPSSPEHRNAMRESRGDRMQQRIAPHSIAQRPGIRGISGEYAGASIPVPATGLALGRMSGGEGRLVFSDDSDVSRRHCTVTYSPESQRFEITDLGSTNGTFVMPGERRLTPNQKLMCSPGQIIRLGRKNEFELVLQ